jgi:hypothetical protein
MRACCLLVLLVACGKSDKPARDEAAAPPPRAPPADAAPPIDAAPAPRATLTVRIHDTAYAKDTAVVGDALWMPGKPTMIFVSTKGGLACPPAKPKEYGPDDFALAFELEGPPTLGTHTPRNEWHMTTASGSIAGSTVTITALEPLVGAVRAVAPDGSVSFVGDFVAARCDVAP